MQRAQTPKPCSIFTAMVSTAMMRHRPEAERQNQRAE